MNPIIEIKDLKYSYGNTTAIRDINITINEGDWISIVGHNGSGKSTLSKLIVGLLELQEGKIIVDGLELSNETLYDIRSRIGIVFQNPDNQFVGTTVEDDIAFGLENLGVKRDDMKERIFEFSNKVGMHDFLEREPHSLSGGQKQRVAIAGVLAMHPKILILDEATSMLDPKGRSEIISTINKLYNDEKITIISITHDLAEAAMANKIIVLNNGLKYMEGTPDEIFKYEEKLVDIGLDIPFSVKVTNKLLENGIKIQTALSDKELVDKLWKLYSKT